MEKNKGRRGRPPSVGRELTSHFPTLTISMRPATKTRLEAISMLTRLPGWRVVEDALGLYVDRMSAEDRKVIESLGRRVEARIEEEERGEQVSVAAG